MACTRLQKLILWWRWRKKETLYTQHAILLCTQSTVRDTFMEIITIWCLNFSCHIVPGCRDNVSVWMIFVAIGVNKRPDPQGSDEFFVNHIGKLWKIRRGVKFLDQVCYAWLGPSPVSLKRDLPAHVFFSHPDGCDSRVAHGWVKVHYARSLRE